MTDLSPTLQSLLRIGFTPDEPEWGMGCVSYDLPHLPLRCSDWMGSHFRPVVRVSGIYKDRRTLGQVASEIPANLGTTERAAAWLFFVLKDYLRRIDPKPDWVALGQANQMLVPMVAERAAYEQRPKCLVAQDFARILRARVTEGLAEQTEETSLRIDFDGKLLRFATATVSVEVPANGDAWSGHIFVPRPKDFQFPKRIPARGLWLHYWKSAFGIGDRSYDAQWISSELDDQLTFDFGAVE